MANYLDKDGLEYYNSKINEKIPTNSNIVDLIYPVGAIYMSVNNTNPGTLFGGTWEQIKDKFMLSAGDTYAGGATGGSASQSYTPSGSVGNHTLTTAELPKHTHTYSKSATTSDKSSGSTGGPSNNTSGGPSNNNTSGVAISVAQMPSHDHGYGANIQHSDGDKVTGESLTSGLQVGGRRRYWDSTSKRGDGGTHSHTLNSHTHSLNSHTHSLNSHTHGITLTSTNSGDGGFAGNGHNHGFTGTASTINTLPPYLAVYVWKRTA